MKNFTKLLGIAVLCTVIVFAMTGCGGSDTYELVIFRINDANYTNAFYISPPSEGQFHRFTETRNAIAPKVLSAYSYRISIYHESYGNTLSEVETYINAVPQLTSTERSQTINALKSTGFVVAAKKQGGTNFVFAISSE